MEEEKEFEGEKGRPLEDKDYIAKDEFERLKAEGEVQEHDISEQIDLRSKRLSKEDYNICGKIFDKVHQFVVKPNYENEDELAKHWYSLVKKDYNKCESPVQLKLKAEVSNPEMVPFHIFAIKLAKNKPYIFLMIGGDQHINMIDEGRFDAFVNGPFERPE